MQIARNFVELEAVRGGEREHDVVLGSGGLQLEIELAAKAFAQRQTPGAIDAAAIGRMDDELHAARFIEEALQHDGILRRQAAERRVRRSEIFDQLLARRLCDADLRRSANATRSAPVGSRSQRCGSDLVAQARHRLGELIAAARRFAEPERNGRRHAVRVFDAHHAALDAPDPVALVAELEDVAGKALDREILIHGADEIDSPVPAGPGSRHCLGWCRRR